MAGYDAMSEAEQTAAARTATVAAGVTVAVEQSSRDPLRWLSIAAATGLVVAASLAIFGLPPVDLHLPPHHLGIMDPACGGTRGVAATMRGDLAKAWWYNPASPLVIAGGFAALARWVVGRLTGRWVIVRLRATPLVVVVLGVLLVALEVNQQLHVDRLR
jgi:hypothetical protein